MSRVTLLFITFILLSIYSGNTFATGGGGGGGGSGSSVPFIGPLTHVMLFVVICWFYKKKQ